MQAAYSKPLSLWQLVEQHAAPHEQDELKDMLGQSLVEQSLELHAEIDMLLEIWRDVREEASESSRPQSTLPEPPNQRDRLVQEICFFVENVKDQAKKKGIDPEHILKRHNTDILDYAADKSRPGTAWSRASRDSDGRETPMAVLSPDRLDLAYNMTDQVEAVNKQLNFMEFGKVCLSLRTYLEKEVEQLLEDVQFLQGCLDEAADTRDCTTPALTSREPTLSELREERSSLEKELFATEKLSATPAVHKAMFTTSTRVLPRTPPTPKGRRSPASPPPSKFATKTGSISHPNRSGGGPLKACHEVMTNILHDFSSQDGSRNVSGDIMPHASSSRESICDIDFSPLSLDSSPLLDAEYFGFSEENDGLNSQKRDDKEDQKVNLPVQKQEHRSNHQRSQVNHTDPQHGMSKSGSCIDKGKSPLSSLLPSPPTIPGTFTASNLPQSTVPSETVTPLPSHSDSDLMNTTPHPPSQRPGMSAGLTHTRRRTVSPRPRFRVVDVTNLVGAHKGKGDSPEMVAQNMISFTSSSPSSSFTSSTSSTILSPVGTSTIDTTNLATATGVTSSPNDILHDREPVIRPRSANRFREMVLGCRDGQ